MNGDSIDIKEVRKLVIDRVMTLKGSLDNDDMTPAQRGKTCDDTIRFALIACLLGELIRRGK